MTITGSQYEYLYALSLKCKGYPQVKVIGKAGDQGVDIIASKDHKKYAFQCKYRTTRPLGNTPIQEVYSGKNYHHCDYAIVVTNNIFTKQAKQLAITNNVTLAPQMTVDKLIKVCSESYKDGKIDPDDKFLGKLPDEIKNKIISKNVDATKEIDTIVDVETGRLYKPDELDTIHEKPQSYTLSMHNNAIQKQQVDNPQKNDTSIQLYRFFLIIMGFFDLLCWVTPYAGIFAIFAAFLCVNPKWYKSKKYRKLNIIIGIVLMCIGLAAYCIILFRLFCISNMNSNRAVELFEEMLEQTFLANKYSVTWEVQIFFLGIILICSSLPFLFIRRRKNL